MLKHPAMDKLHALKFTGTNQALNEQMNQPDIGQLNFEQRLGLLVDREMTERANRRLISPLRQARLKQPACTEDFEYRHAHGLDKALMADLARCQ